MVEFRPLQALEYSPSAGELASLIAPPYDVIDAPTRRMLAARSPYNVVHISLPEDEGGLDKYEAAASTFSSWMAQGVLIRSQTAFYVVEQTFEVGGKQLVRTGILGQARLVPWGQGIYPHEITLPKPREDRLKLFRATRAVPGPTFTLFADKSGSVRTMLSRVKTTAPYRTADGPEGSFDRIWKITDAETIGHISTAVANEELFIADGHHRYETALTFRDELARGRALPEDHPANFVLTCAVPFDDPGLVILPTHRLLSLEGGTAARSAVDLLSADYDVSPTNSLKAFEGIGQGAPAPMAVYIPGSAHLLRMRERARVEFRKAAGDVMAAVNTYEVLKVVLPRFFADVQQAVDHERIKYAHSLADAVARVDSGEFQAGVILAPLTVKRMVDVASRGKVMPPKSTYFHPKLPTGIAIKPLE